MLTADRPTPQQRVASVLLVAHLHAALLFALLHFLVVTPKARREATPAQLLEMIINTARKPVPAIPLPQPKPAPRRPSPSASGQGWFEEAKPTEAYVLWDPMTLIPLRPHQCRGISRGNAVRATGGAYVDELL